MMKKTGKIFGREDRTPGKNFIIAMLLDKTEEAREKVDAPIGVPPYNYEKLYEIFESTLTKEETELLLKGFGFDRPRVQNKQIAAEMGLASGQVTELVKKTLSKLQKNSVKKQIMGLVPTTEELLKLAELGLKNEAEEKKDDELKCRYENAVKNEETLIAKLKNRDIQLGRAKYDYKVLHKKLDIAKEENNSQKKIILDLEKKLAEEKSKAKVAREKYREMEDTIFSTLPSSSDSTSVADELKLTAEVKESLNRVGIKDIETLCSLSQSSLAKMGIGQKGISEIKTALKSKGLSLR